MQKDSLCALARRFCINRKGGTGGGGWGYPQGAMHMVAVRLGCESSMVGTRLANLRPGCMSRLRKCYSHLLEGSFLAGRLLRLKAGVCLLRVLTIACSLMSGHG